MRRAARKDDNHSEITKGLQDIGCSVLELYQLGQGAPDILVGTRGRNILMEIKDGSKPPSRQRLTADEEAFHNSWRGTVYVVSSLQQAIDIVATTASHPRWRR